MNLGPSILKVSKNGNDFIKTLFGPKSNVIIVRISALLYNRIINDNNYVAFWSKRCLHKIISIFIDL